VLRRSYIEIRNEHHLQPLTDAGVCIDHFSYGINQLDNQLRHHVPRRRLTPEQDRSRSDTKRRITFQTVVKRENMKNIQVLPLVLMNALRVDIEKRRRIRCDSSYSRNVRRQIGFVVLLDLAPFLLERRIVR
jgi:hypothetical protein